MSNVKIKYFEFLNEVKINSNNVNSEKSIKLDVSKNTKKPKPNKKVKVKIGKYEEAPNYLKDNEYIKSGYLFNCHSFK